MCGGVFFDPVPTLWHAIWIALVPGVNAWLLSGGRGGGDKLKGAAAGFVFVTACFYGLLFLPLIHLSVIAILFVGMGFLSLTPVLAALSTWRIGRAAGASAGDARAFKTGWLGGVAASLLILSAILGSTHNGILARAQVSSLSPFSIHAQLVDDLSLSCDPVTTGYWP